jgi:hypothetical protein
MVNPERLKCMRHFLRAFIQWPQIRTFHLVLSVHLFDQQFGIALHPQRSDSVRLGVVQRCDQSEILRHVVCVLSDILLQPRDHFTFAVSNQYSISRRPRISP